MADLWSWACENLDKTVNTLSFSLDMKRTDSELDIAIHDVTIYDKASDQLNSVSVDKLQETGAFPLDRMTFSARENTVMSFYHQYGFTSWDVIQSILAFERENRPKTEWFDGIDCHHVYFEGVYPANDKTLRIYWGS